MKKKISNKFNPIEQVPEQMPMLLMANVLLEPRRCTAALYVVFSTCLWQQPASWKVWFYLEEYLL